MKYKIAAIFLCLFVVFNAAISEAGEKVTFCAVGDILLDRGVRATIDKRTTDYLFEKTSDFLKLCDLSFCNLESPLSSQGEPLEKTYSFRGDPSFVYGLKKSGLNIFSLANNHILDYGWEALLDTKEILEKNGLHTVGAGQNYDDASKATIINKKGLNFAILSYVDLYPIGIEYKKDFPMPAFANIDRIVQEIKRVRSLVDFVIVSFHWGTEFTVSPLEKHKVYAHKVIDNGADLVIGHHPHVIQSIEKYNGKLIIYSLGNFIFDQKRLDGRESILFVCVFSDKEIVSSYIIPLIIDDYQPDFAEGEDYKRISDKIKTISKKFGVSFKENNNVIFLE